MKKDLSEFTETIEAAIDAMLNQNNPLLIMNDDEDAPQVQLELDTQLEEKGVSNEQPRTYHFINLHHDGDMLDELLEIYLSSKVQSPDISATELLSSQKGNIYKFTSLVNLLTRDKFIIFHIKEDVIRLFFEVVKYAENEELINQSSPRSRPTLEYDNLVRRFFNESTMKKLDRSMSILPLRRLSVLLSSLSASFMHLVQVQSKILVLMNWRTYALLNTMYLAPDIWSRVYFRLFDISKCGLALIPGSTLELFMKNLNLPPNLRAEIEQNCDKKYPRFGVPEGSWEGAPNPENWYKWQKYWVEQMTRYNVPTLVEEKLRKVLRQPGESEEKADQLIRELKETKIGSFNAYRTTAEILLDQSIPGEVIDFILQVMIRGFGQTLHQARELKEDSSDIEEKEQVDQVKIAILGFGGVGKTTFLHALREEFLLFDQGIGVSSKKTSEKIRNLNIVVWDLAGQSRFSILWAKMIANAQIVVIITDSTLENVLRSKKLVSLVKEEVPDARIIAMANKQDLPTALKPERVSEILGVPTDGISAIDPTTFEDLTHTEAAIRDALARYSTVMFFRYVITVVYDDEGEMLEILQKFDSAASSQALQNIGHKEEIESILDMTFRRHDDLHRWLQLFLVKIPMTTEAINSLIMGLGRGLIDAQNEVKRILSKFGVPGTIIDWIIERLSS